MPTHLSVEPLLLSCLVLVTLDTSLSTFYIDYFSSTLKEEVFAKFILQFFGINSKNSFLKNSTYRRNFSLKVCDRISVVWDLLTSVYYFINNWTFNNFKKSIVFIFEIFKSIQSKILSREKSSQLLVSMVLFFFHLHLHNCLRRLSNRFYL